MKDLSRLNRDIFFMIDTFYGNKITQSQSFTSDGRRIPVTMVKVAPNKVVTTTPVFQVGIGTRRPVTVSKAILGHLKKAGLDSNPPRFLREIRLSDIGDLKPGTEIKAGDVLKVGDKVSITGISKGKGFAGAVKRHHFRGGPRTHGQSDRERAPGSIGQTTTPGRVYKGKRMAGRMGQDKVTVKNLKVVSIDIEKNILTVSGLVPGGRNSLLMINKIK